MSSVWKFRFKRVKDFIGILFRSRMATAGIIVLVLFIFMALAAPLLTPYNPDLDKVSGIEAHPSWFTSFGEGARLSQNFNLESQTTFSSDPFTNGWISSPSDPKLSASYSPNISAQGTGGSIKITLDKSSSP